MPDTNISDEQQHFLERRIKDTTVNGYGNKLLGLFQENLPRVRNGSTLRGLNGKLTCFKCNGSSAVDCVLPINIYAIK